MKAKNRKVKGAKQRILDAAVTLFARKGYAAVGVREIAQKANVNIAMISYYFGGKIGILKAIMEEFFKKYSEIFRDIDYQNSPLEESIRMMVTNIVNFVKTNTDLTMIAYNELALDIPEISKLKVEKVAQMIEGSKDIIMLLNVDPVDTLHLTMIGPSLFSIVVSHFRLRSVFQRTFHIRTSKSYYEEFINTITTLFMYGITGINKAQLNKRGIEDKNSG